MSWASRRLVLRDGAANNVGVAECYTASCSRATCSTDPLPALISPRRTSSSICTDSGMMAATDSSPRSGNGFALSSSDILTRTPTSSAMTSAPTKPSPSASPRIPSDVFSESSTNPPPTSGAVQAAKSTTEESLGESTDSSTSPPSAVRLTTQTSSESETTQLPSSQNTLSTGSPASGIGDFDDPVGTLITTVTAPDDTDIAVVKSTFVSSISTIPSHTSTDEPPPAFTDSWHAAQAEHPPLSNGATAGIVLAVVAVLLGTFFLARYIYKKRGFCSKSRSFSPSRESYYRFPAGPISRPVPQDTRRHSWLSHPGSQPGGNYPSVVITPGQNESIELQTFTRPVHGPRMYDVGHSGNAPIAPPYNGYPQQDSHGRPMSPSRPPIDPAANQTVQEEPVSPESPHASASAPESEGRSTSALRDRRGAVPWEEGYRYRAW